MTRRLSAGRGTGLSTRRPTPASAAPRTRLRIRLPALLLACGLALAWLAAAAPGAGAFPAQVVPLSGEDAYPHDPEAFTQGLAFAHGLLYESTGLYGASSVRVVEPVTGAVLRQADLAPELFGEGLAVAGDRLIQLTWRAGRALVFDRATLKPAGDFAFPPEGWGLAAAPGGVLYQSRGDEVLILRDQETFEELGRVRVTDQGRPVTRLNELEWIEGTLWCNIWRSDLVAVADPETGRVLQYLDLSEFRRALGPGAGVANGIAYDPESMRVFLTGKNWDKVFVVRLAVPGRSMSDTASPLPPEYR